MIKHKYFRVILAAAAALFAAACSQKEDLNLTQAELDAMKEEEEVKPETQEEEITPDYESVVFDASFEDNSFSKTSSTETEYGTYRIEWKESDAITVFSSSNEGGVKFVVKEVDKDNPTKATFIKDPSETKLIGEGPYWAAYPYGAATYCEQKMFFTQATSQVYAEGSIPDGANNAAAYTEDTSLKFKNVCGVVKFTLTASEAVQLKSINLTDPYAGLGGQATVIMGSEGGIETLNPYREACSSIDLDCEGVSLGAEPKVFNIICPVGAFSKALKLTVENTEGKVFSKTSTSAEGGNTVVRSKVLQMPTLNCNAFTDKPQLEEITFDASSETVGEDGTKTSTELSGNTISIKWTKGDKIIVFTKDAPGGCLCEFQGEGGTTSGSFKGWIPSSGPYWAVYPTTGWNFNNSTDPPTLTYNNSDEYTYKDGSVPEGSLPMVAYSTSEKGKTPTFKFKNLFGVLCVPIQDLEAGGRTVETVEISDINGGYLVGTTTFTMNGSEASNIVITGTVSSSKTITVNGDITIPYRGSGGTTSKKFFFPVPGGSFSASSSLKVRVIKNQTYSNKDYEYDYFLKSSGTGTEVTRGNCQGFASAMLVQRLVYHDDVEANRTVELGELANSRTILHPGNTYTISPKSAGSSVHSVLYTVNDNYYDCSPKPTLSWTSSNPSGSLTVTIPSSITSGYFRIAVTSDVAPKGSNKPKVTSKYYFVSPVASSSNKSICSSVNCAWYGGKIGANLVNCDGKTVTEGASTYTINGTEYTKGSTPKNSANNVDISDCTSNIVISYTGTEGSTTTTRTYSEPGPSFTEKAFFEGDVSGSTFYMTVPVFSKDQKTVYILTSVNSDTEENILYAYSLSEEGISLKWSKSVGYTMRYNQIVMVNPVTDDVIVSCNTYQQELGTGDYAGGEASSYNGHKYFLKAFNSSGTEIWSSMLGEGNSWATAPRRAAVTITSDGLYIFVCTVNGHMRFINATNGALIGAVGSCKFRSIISLDLPNASGSGDPRYYIFASAACTPSSTATSTGLYQWTGGSDMTRVSGSSDPLNGGTYEYDSPCSDCMYCSSDGDERHFHHYYIDYESGVASHPTITREWYVSSSKVPAYTGHMNSIACSSATSAHLWGMSICLAHLYLAQVYTSTQAIVSHWNTGLDQTSVDSYYALDGSNNDFHYATPIIDANQNVYITPIASTAKIIKFASAGSKISSAVTVAQSTTTMSGLNGCFNMGGYYYVIAANNKIFIRKMDTGRTGRTNWSGYRGDPCGTNNINTVYPDLYAPLSENNYMYGK